MHIIYTEVNHTSWRCISEIVSGHASKDWLSMHTQGMQR